jgi:phenylacetate-coenzyme A ligase PaaK-like adenylate-forming protein
MLAQAPMIARHFAGAKWRGAALARYQDARARAIVAYVAAHSPFYRAHWARRDLADWRTLSTVDKRLMMEHFDTFNTCGLSRDEAMALALAAELSRDFTPTLRGVASASPLVPPATADSSPPAPRSRQGGPERFRRARSLDRFSGRLRVAFFLRSNSNLYEQVGGLLIQLRYFDLMRLLDEAVARLNLVRPHVVVGPPSLLGFLADARLAGRLRIRPERLVSVAEVLESQDRERLAVTFDAPAHQI